MAPGEAQSAREMTVKDVRKNKTEGCAERETPCTKIHAIFSKTKGKTCYIGESNRSLGGKMKEHWDDTEGKEKEDNSHMYVHAITNHEGEIKFSCKIIGVHHRALEQQICKAASMKTDMR